MEPALPLAGVAGDIFPHLQLTNKFARNSAVLDVDFGSAKTTISVSEATLVQQV